MNIRIKKEMLERKGNLIYLKYIKKNIFENILSIILLLIFCILAYIIFNISTSEYDWINIFLQNKITKIIFIVGIVIFLYITIYNIIFYNNCDYHINMQTNKIYFINGNRKYKKEIVLDFIQIKNIILVETIIEGEGGKIYTYQIDLYDNELNAYEIYKNKNYDETKNISTKIGELVNAEVIDWTHIENYEGYKKRVI